MKNLFFVIGILFLFSSCTTTFYIVRHAEKQGGSNPSLTVAGQQRANDLRDELAGVGIDNVITSHLNRTIETGAPTAVGNSLTAESINAGDMQALVDRCRSFTDNRQILVVGHSNTVPMLIDSLLKREEGISISEDDFDNLFIVKIKRGTSVVRRFERRTYGTNSP